MQTILQKTSSITDISIGKTFRFSEIEHLILQRKKVYQSAGLSKNDVVILTNNNSIHFFVDLFTLWEMQAIAFPIEENRTSEFLQKIALSVKARYIVDLKNSLQPVQGSFNSENNLFQGCLLLLSSGTDGGAKVIELSLARILDRVQNIQKMISSSLECGLVFLPTSFGHGLIANSLTTLYRGGHLVLHPKELAIFSKLQENIIRYSVEYFSTVPTHFEMFHKLRLSFDKIKTPLEIHCASATLRTKSYQKALSLFETAHFHYHYGMTEAGSWISHATLNRNIEKFDPFFVGPAFGLKVENKNATDTLHICNEVTDLNIFRIEHSNLTTLKKGEWLDTKDVGHISDQGIFLNGRAGDFINKGGYKISPFEVEEVIMNLPEINNCYAFSIESEFQGEDIGLVVIGTEQSDILDQQIIEICLQKLGPQKTPKKIFYTKDLLFLNQNKISRKKLSAYFSR